MFFIFLLYTVPVLAVLALCAFVADEIIPCFPRVVDWILNFMERW